VCPTFVDPPSCDSETRSPLLNTMGCFGLACKYSGGAEASQGEVFQAGGEGDDGFCVETGVGDGACPSGPWKPVRSVGVQVMLADPVRRELKVWWSATHILKRQSSRPLPKQPKHTVQRLGIPLFL